MSARAGGLRAALDGAGYLVLREPVSLEGFYGLARTLGEVILETDVRISPEKDASLYSADSMPFHTDHFDAAYIGWYCITPGEGTGGATTLIDARDLERAFSAPELAALAEIGVTMPGVGGGETSVHPLLSRSGAGYSVYYTPWFVEQPRSAKRRAALRKWERFLAARAAEATRAVRLGRAECFFIDNRRVLHGRNGLDPKTPRHLRRLWIKAGAAS